MGRNRFVDESDTVRLDLSDGDWIDVRREIGYGRSSRMAMAAIGGVQASALDGDSAAEVSINWEGFGIARIETWVVGWSFRDRDGRSRPVERRTIEQLDPDTAQEIITALDAHQAAREAEHASPNGSRPLTPV